MNIQKYLDKSKNAKCLIVGDIMLDRYLYGEVSRISPEAPIPIVQIHKRIEGLGGAANVANNVKAFSCKVHLVGVLGKDDVGHTIQQKLRDNNIDFNGIILDSRCSTLKTRIIGKGQQMLRIDEETPELLDDLSSKDLIEKILEQMSDTDVIVLSDYKKGVCTKELCHSIISEANKLNKKVVVDPKGTDWEKYRGAFVVTPNWKEFTAITGPISESDESILMQKARAVLDKYGFQNILITRSEKGMVLINREGVYNFKAEAREVADVSGAGDTVIATMASFLAVRESLMTSVEWANKAAGLAVERRGTSVIGIDDIFGKNKAVTRSYVDKLMNIETLLDTIAFKRSKNERVVFTNGCFDILHTGHIQYLDEAKALGDYLIVAVNSDDSIRRQGKGNDRPYVSLRDRMLQLAALQMVDAVVTFEEDTPYELLSRIKPDVLVKGGDYQVTEIVGREFAGQTLSLSLKKGYSTTELVKKIRME